MTRAALILELCHAMGWPGSIGRCPQPYRARAEFAAPLILAHAKAIEPTLLGAVLIKESGMRPLAVGRAGEIGMAQILPTGAALRFCRDLDIHAPADNVTCAVRILTMHRRRCGGDPSRFLGGFKGWQACGPSDYSRRVLLIRDGRGREIWTRPHGEATK